jgi:hypothetical protein
LLLIFPLAPAHQRAAVVTVIYIVAYIAFGVPVVIAGQLAALLGVAPTVFWYSAVTALLALISLAAQLRLGSGARAPVRRCRGVDLRTTGTGTSPQTDPAPAAAGSTKRAR